MKLKRIVTIALIAVLTTSLFAMGDSEAMDNRKSTSEAMIDSETKALNAVPIPNVSYFNERRTIAEWSKRWDKPSVVTYVYLISYGNILGYYVCNGKPASIQSYLLPETARVRTSSVENSYDREVMDIDGTYGTLNYGIRFFTAEGTAVEWGGMGATYLYSDAPLPINVPKLNATQETN